MRHRVIGTPVSPACDFAWRASCKGPTALVSYTCEFACVPAAVAYWHGKGLDGAQGADQHHAARAQAIVSAPRPGPRSMLSVK